VNCDSCHVALSETSGKPFFTTADTYFTFLIGRNVRRDADRPYEYVPVRHVPVDPGSFAYYGENLLPDFDAQPTWRYATPDNIQRQTPQAENCNNCHGNPDMFLTADKVKLEELAANSAVIIEEIPEVQEE
jgi:thiosulfate/3-mercaptopyruvate sulfurtransferase